MALASNTYTVAVIIVKGQPIYSSWLVKKPNGGASFKIGNNYKKLHQKSLKLEMVLEEFGNQRQLNGFSVTFNVVPTQIPYYFRKWDKIVVRNEEKTTLLGLWIKVNLCLFCFMFLAVPTIVPKALYLAKNTLPLKYSVCPFCCYVFLISFWDRVSLCSLC